MNREAASLSVEEITEVVLRLPREKVLYLDRRIHEFLETTMLSRAAESAFSEWDDPEEDIYSSDV